MEADLRALGADDGTIKKWRATESDTEDDGASILPENEAIVRAFLVCASQWRLAPSGKPYALDYTAVEAVLRMTRVPSSDRRRIFGGVQVMEAAALEVWREHDVGCRIGRLR